ncbi:MAG: hypothetical protein R3C97_01465 [Geminicoccaceae bacterium]
MVGAIDLRLTPPIRTCSGIVIVGIVISDGEACRRKVVGALEHTQFVRGGFETELENTPDTVEIRQEGVVELRVVDFEKVGLVHRDADTAQGGQASADRPPTLLPAMPPAPCMTSRMVRSP